MDWKKILCAFAFVTALPVISENYGYAQEACYTPATPNFGKESWGCLNVGAYVDWIYWIARRPDLDYAVDVPTRSGVGVFGDVHRLTPKYESSYRVGGGSSH